ncbi:MAG TPA: efflux RND transporter periplasmic adaptor subunit [Burkholderiales bacterium]|nr:efflux RND transporter periplasmic adaptor subunit [Burkholderiales bacterium]
MNRARLLAAAVPAAVLVLSACGKEEAAPQRPPPVVSVMVLKAQTIPMSPTFVAQTESSRQVDIVARVSGYLDRIAYAEGQLVKEGELLFQIDPRPFQAQLQSAEGELLAQKARLTTAAATLRRVAPLVKQDALPLSDLDKAQGEYESANAAVFSANARVTEAKLNLAYASIRSPVSGVASRSLQRQGAFINAQGENAKLTYVATLDPMWVNFSVSQNQLAKWRDMVKKGQLVLPQNLDYRIEIVLSDGAVYGERGRTNFADPSFDKDTGTFLVRSELPNPKHDLRPGMFVTARVLGATQPNAIVIPQLAVQQGSNGHFAFVVNDKGVAEIRQVLLGDYQGAKDVVVLGGLRDGDQLIVDGALKVVAGQPVKIEKKL